MHLKKCDLALYISFIYKNTYRSLRILVYSLSIDNHLKICHNRLGSLVRCEIKCKLCDAIGSNYAANALRSELCETIVKLC